MNVLRILTVIVSSIIAGLVSARAVLTLFEPVYETWEIAPWRVIIFSLVFIASFSLFFYQMVYERQSFLSFLKRPVHLIVIAILTYLFYFSTVGEMFHLEEEGSIGSVPIIIIAVLTYALLIWAVMYRMIATDWHIYWKKHQPSPLTIVYFGLPIVLIGLIYWIGFFPGPMTPDSFHHWRQSLDYDFSNWHPMIYTVLTIVLTSIWDNPAVVTLFQVLFIGAVWGYTMFSLRRIGLPYISLIVATVIVTIIPITGIYAVTFWKDVLYSVLLLLFTVYFMNIVISKGTWFAVWRNVILLTVTMLALAFFRNNGLPIVLVSLIALGLMHLKYWRAIVVPIVVTFVTYIIVTGPVFSALDVNPAQSIESLSIPHQQIGYILNNEDGTLTEQHAAELDYYMPVEAWKEAYHPFLSDHIKFHPELDRDRLADDIPGYIGTWAGIVGNNFGLAVEGYLYQTSIVWQIHEPSRAYTASYASQVMDNPHGLEMSPLSERMHHGLMNYLTFTDEQLLELIWRPALFILLILLATSAGVIKNGVRFLLISAPVILNWGTMLAAIPAQDFRYMLPNFFILFVIALLAFGKFKLEHKQEDLH